jgi:transcription elongation GreA/GreB family factor
MKPSIEVKEQLYQACEKLADERIQSIQQVLKSIENARNNETKSSAGDKYETGRSMMQIEEDNNRTQLHNALQVKNTLTGINPNRITERVEAGSLVATTQGNYYLSIGMGAVNLKNQSYFCISVQSPIGRQLIGKSTGDEISINGMPIKITGVC